METALRRYGRNCKTAPANGFELGLTLPVDQRSPKNLRPEKPPTPLWQPVLKQFKDQLVIRLLASVAVSFVLAFLEEGAGPTPSVDLAVVSNAICIFPAGALGKCADVWSRSLIS